MNKREQLQINNTIWSSIGDQLRNQINHKFYIQLNGHIYDKLRDQLWSKVLNELRGHISYQNQKDVL